ncbi:glycosyltransferase family 2 protein [Streptococcus sp.]
MEKISVIIPFYKGNEHLSKLRRMIEVNSDNLQSYACVELIIVNDSPWIDVDYNCISSEKYELKIVKHERNGGIHQARVSGILESSGNYIYMLDQDDEISDDCLLSLLSSFDDDTEVVFGNGIYEVPNGSSKFVFDNYSKAMAAKNGNYYLYLGNFLSSPGQCLIKKSVIPDFWKNNIMKTNCSDDLFLWILLMKKERVKFCNKVVYLHKNTGKNVSLDKKNGYFSDEEVLNFLKRSDIGNKFPLWIFKLRCRRNLSKYSSNRKKMNIFNGFYNVFEILIKLKLKVCSYVYFLFGKCLDKTFIKREYR